VGSNDVVDEAGIVRCPIARFCRTHQLSPQETKLLRAAVQELTNDQAADALGCAPSTIRTYWTRIFQKVGCARERDVLARVVRFMSGPPTSDGETGAPST